MGALNRRGKRRPAGVYGLLAAIIEQAFCDVIKPSGVDCHDRLSALQFLDGLGLTEADVQHIWYAERPNIEMQSILQESRSRL